MVLRIVEAHGKCLTGWESVLDNSNCDVIWAIKGLASTILPWSAGESTACIIFLQIVQGNFRKNRTWHRWHIPLNSRGERCHFLMPFQEKRRRVKGALRLKRSKEQFLPDRLYSYGAIRIVEPLKQYWRILLVYKWQNWYPERGSDKSKDTQQFTNRDPSSWA